MFKLNFKRESSIKKIFIYLFLTFLLGLMISQKLNWKKKQVISKNVVCVTRCNAYYCNVFSSFLRNKKKGLCVYCFSNKQHLDILESFRNLTIFLRRSNRAGPINIRCAYKCLKLKRYTEIVVIKSPLFTISK